MRSDEIHRLPLSRSFVARSPFDRLKRSSSKEVLRRRPTVKIRRTWAVAIRYPQSQLDRLKRSSPERTSRYGGSRRPAPYPRIRHAPRVSLDRPRLLGPRRGQRRSPLSSAWNRPGPFTRGWRSITWPRSASCKNAGSSYPTPWRKPPMTRTLRTFF